MNFNTHKFDETTILSINTDKAIAEHAPEFRSALLNLIEKSRVRKLVVDFAGVDFVDSTFLSVLVVGLKKITEISGDIKVANLEPPVRVMFELTKLYKVFEVFDNELEAIECF